MEMGTEEAAARPARGRPTSSIEYGGASDSASLAPGDSSVGSFGGRRAPSTKVPRVERRSMR